jgi:hypothetical protein
MLVSHKEYGSTGKELPARVARGSSRRKESGKKDETVIFLRNPAPTQGYPDGDMWVSTPKEKTS